MTRATQDDDGLFADRGTRFGWLRAAVQHLDGVTRSRRSDLKQLVEQYEVKTTNEGYCYLTREQLYESLHWGRTKFDQVRKLAEELGWIEVGRDTGRAGGQGPNRVRVAWERIRTVARPDRLPQSGKRLPQSGKRLPQSGKRLPQSGTPINKEFIPLTSPPNKSSCADEVSVSDSGQERTGGRNPWPIPITVDALRTPQKVAELYDHGVARKWFVGSEVNRRTIEGLAEQAAAKFKSKDGPGRLFTILVKEKLEQPAEQGGLTQWAEAKAAERRRARPPTSAVPLPDFRDPDAEISANLDDQKRRLMAKHPELRRTAEAVAT